MWNWGFPIGGEIPTIRLQAPCSFNLRLFPATIASPSVWAINRSGEQHWGRRCGTTRAGPLTSLSSFSRSRCERNVVTLPNGCWQPTGIASVWPHQDARAKPMRLADIEDIKPSTAPAPGGPQSCRLAAIPLSYTKAPSPSPASTSPAGYPPRELSWRPRPKRRSASGQPHSPLPPARLSTPAATASPASRTALTRSPASIAWVSPVRSAITFSLRREIMSIR